MVPIDLVPSSDDDDALTLPPLPTPNERTKRQELCIGTSIISIVSLFAAGGACAFYFVDSKLSESARIACVAVLGVEIFVALFCLERIAHGDPGVVQRTPETTRPLPRVVAIRLRAGQSLQGLGHVADDRGIFCTLCCVWRPRDQGKCAHCHICQRCVVGFDHHCGFYGRCITKKNMPYFSCVMWVGLAAWLTVILFVVLAVTM